MSTASTSAPPSAVTDKPQLLHFRTPSECRDWIVPEDQLLVGDQHIVRGNVTVIGGPPGVGKSRAALALALAGATGQDWFGLKVHTKFKTVILQAENGPYRLKQEWEATNTVSLDEWILISEPPLLGMAFDKPEFVHELVQRLKEFQPAVIVLDPWNSFVSDDKQKDYREGFSRIRDAIARAAIEVALVIVAHTRKPGKDLKPSGRELLHELCGSLVLGSIPRCVFVMQPASSDTQDERVKWSCPKNNDGKLGADSVWWRRNGTFEPCTGLDAVQPTSEVRRKITRADLERVFEGGGGSLPRKEAAEKLMEHTGLGKSACYAALEPDGKFKWQLKEVNGVLEWFG